MGEVDLYCQSLSYCCRLMLLNRSMFAFEAHPCLYLILLEIDDVSPEITLLVSKHGEDVSRQGFWLGSCGPPLRAL